MVVKRIFKYHKGTKEFVLCYTKANDISRVAYIDVDWVGCIDDKRSISGAYLYLSEFLVSWLSRK
jgi:hypothetical protein